MFKVEEHKKFSVKTALPTRGMPGDLLDLDRNKARLIRLAQEILSGTPEIRPDKVASLKKAVAEGSYAIDSSKLAEIMAASFSGL